MSQYVESMLPSMGLGLDATGNIVGLPGEATAQAAAPAAAAKTTTAATTTTPAATTTPSKTTTADIPVPTTLGQSADTSDAAAVAKKKTLLGG